MCHAYNQDNSQYVAAKKFSKDPRNPALEEDFLNELNIIRMAHNHENIVKYYGHGEDDDNFYLFMTYCTCENLNNYCFDYGPDFYQQLNIMHQSVNGIRHLHGLTPSVAHRDVKVENILLTLEGENVVVKLSDFGTSKISNRDAQTGLTRTMHTGKSYI